MDIIIFYFYWFIIDVRIVLFFFICPERERVFVTHEELARTNGSLIGSAAVHASINSSAT